MKDPGVLTAQRPKRADGRRSFDAIVAAATEAFAAHGASASLEAIAERAGLSIATLYRYFPVRASLIEAVLREDNAELMATGERLRTEADPLPALLGWTQAAIVSCSRFRGLAEALTTGLREDDNPLQAACQAMESFGSELLHAAQDAGQVRVEVTPADLFDLISAAAWLVENDRHGLQLFQIAQHGILTTSTERRGTL